MNKITEEDFYNFLYTQNIITDLIEEKTKELSMILYGRLPKGKMCDVDIWESEFKGGCIFVEFEGSCCKDQYNLPMKFLYDKDYPAIFKREFDEKMRLENEMKKIEEVYERVKLNDRLEKYDICEYERLKVKYE